MSAAAEITLRHMTLDPDLSLAAALDGTAGRGDSVSRAYDQLRELIVHGRLSPGSRIIESDIATRLGLSRTPIRSALHRLQQEGYVSSVDRPKEKRLIVAPLTQADAMELFQIVGQLEGLAARAAAGRPAGERADLVAQLRTLNADFASAGRAVPPDPSTLFDLDMAFHRAYVEAGAGPRLLSLHRAIKPQAERYARLYVNALLDEIRTSAAEHEVINAAIESGALHDAQHAVESNWRNAAHRLSRVIGARGELGSW
jgi:DNA-binding GntR family transcriptional regulator